MYDSGDKINVKCLLQTATLASLWRLFEANQMLLKMSQQISLVAMWGLQGECSIIYYVEHLLPLSHILIEITIQLWASERLTKHLKFLICLTHFMFQFTNLYQKVPSLKINKFLNSTHFASQFHEILFGMPHQILLWQIKVRLLYVHHLYFAWFVYRYLTLK